MNFRLLLLLAIFTGAFYSCEDELTEETNGTAEVFFTISEIREVENASQALALNIGLDNPLHGGGTVDVSITGGEYGTDFTTNAGSANFTVDIDPGTLVSTFTISPEDDEVIGENKNLIIELTNATGSLSLGASTQINFTILDDDDPLVAFVDFETETASVAENSDSNLMLNFIFDQATTNGGTISVSGSGDAVYGTDYTIVGQDAADFTINVPAGATSASFELSPIDNTAFDADKMVIFEVTEVSGGLSVGTLNTIEVTIVNDDAAPNPVIDFSSANPSSFTEADGTVTLNFVLSEATTTESTVTIAAGGSAGIGIDYTLNGAITSPYDLVIPAGATSASINLELIDDTATEDDEDITLTITNINGGLAAGVDLQQQSYTLTDNDATAPFSYLETFESYDGSATYLTDVLGYQSFGLSAQTVGDNQILDVINNNGSFSDPSDPATPSDNGLNFFYNAGSGADYTGDGTVDNVLITKNLDVTGDVNIAIDAAYAFRNQNTAVVTFYYSTTYDGSGTFNESDWTVLGTETDEEMNDQGFGNNSFKREQFSITTDAPIYIAIRITQDVTADNYRLRWRFDNIQVNNNQ